MIIEKNCGHCGDLFSPTNNVQKYCKTCIPDSRFSVFHSRYGISAPEYQKSLDGTNGICPICQKRKATCIDHCHETGVVRGIICSYCNSGLHLIEERGTLARALEYLEKKQSCIPKA